MENKKIKMLKNCLKKKIKVTKGLMIAFLITGIFSFSKDVDFHNYIIRINDTNTIYEFIDKETNFSPLSLDLTRINNDLKVLFESRRDLGEYIIENFYDGNKKKLIGLSEDGRYYRYGSEVGSEDYDYNNFKNNDFGHFVASTDGDGVVGDVAVAGGGVSGGSHGDSTNGGTNGNTISKEQNFYFNLKNKENLVKVNKENTIEFIDGKGTTATVTPTDNGATVKYDVNVDGSTIYIGNDGKLKANIPNISNGDTIGYDYVVDGENTKLILGKEMKQFINGTENYLNSVFKNPDRIENDFLNDSDIPENVRNEVRKIVIDNKELLNKVKSGNYTENEFDELYYKMGEMWRSINDWRRNSENSNIDIVKNYRDVFDIEIGETGVTTNTNTDISIKIDNLSDGLINETSKEAINGSQLHSIAKASSTDIDVNAWRNKLGITDNVATPTNINIKAGDTTKAITDGNTVEYINGSGTTASVTPTDNGATVKYDVNVDGSTLTINDSNKLSVNIDGTTLKIGEDGKIKADLDGYAKTDGSNIKGEDKTSFITNLNDGFNLTNPTGAVATDRDLKDLGDAKLNVDANNLTDNGKTNLVTKLSDGSSLDKPTGALVTDTIVKDKLDTKADKDASNINGTDLTAWRDKLNSGISLENPTGALVKDSDLKNALGDKLNTDLSNFDNTKVDAAGKTKLITALNDGFNLDTPSGAVATDRDLKAGLAGKLSDGDITNNYLTGKLTKGNVVSSTLTLTNNEGRILGADDLTIELKNSTVGFNHLDKNLQDLINSKGTGNGTATNINIKAGDITKAITDGNTIEYINGKGTIATVTSTDNGATVKYDVNVDGTTLIIGEDGKVKANLDGYAKIDGSNITGNDKTSFINNLNDGFNLTNPTGAVATDRDLKVLGDGKADINLNNITTIGDKGKEKLKEALITGNLDNPTGNLVTDTDIKEKLDTKANKDASNISGTDLTAWRDKLNSGVNLETPTGALVKDSDLKNALGDKLNTNLSNFDNTKVDATGKTKLITALNDGFNISNPTGAVATDRDLKSLGDGKLNVDADNLSDTGKTNLVTKLSDGSNLDNPTGVLVTDTAVKAKLDDKANKDASNISGTDLTAWRDKLNSGINLETPTGALVKDSDLKNALGDKLNIDADNLTDKGTTNLVNKLSNGADINNPTNKLVTDTMLKPILEDKLNTNLSNFDNTKVDAAGKTKLITALNDGFNLDTPSGAVATDRDLKAGLAGKLSDGDITNNYLTGKLTKGNVVSNTITITNGNERVLGSEDLRLEISDGAITKDKLANDLKNEIDAKANKDASNLNDGDVSKWRDKLGINDNGNNEFTEKDGAITYNNGGSTGFRIGNVSTPIYLNDASNKKYVDDKFNDLNNKLNAANAGVASALATASTLKNWGNGKHTISGSLGYYEKTVAGAIAYSTHHKNFGFLANASFNSEKKFGAGLGMSYTFGVEEENKDVINVVAPALAGDNDERIKELENQNKELADKLNDLMAYVKNIKVSKGDTYVNDFESYIISGFDSDKYFLKSHMKQQLDEIAKKSVGREIIVVGFTDTDGSDKYNLTLGLNRANTVKEYLEAKGVQVKQTRTAGFNENIRFNNSSSNKALNRRVEIFIK
ncbi:OmpA family protein [Streptobacillus felis]|uniref:OmpA family protein n=1 Tax=Streptobacillus felis TaxID=1384509 RepID=UPI00082F0602|nr:OmpA family protein [Streptobacillus felis]